MKRAVLLAVSLAVAFSGTLAASEKKKPAPFPEFSAKRVKPPSKGTKRRINIQIEPTAPAATAAPAVAGNTGTGRASGAGSYPWFWQAVSPRLDAGSSGRLEPALVALSSAPAGANVRAPRLQTMQDIVAGRGVDILTASVSTQVSPALILAVMAVESSGRTDAVSGAGAQGLMQLMPATAERFGVTDPFDPRQNIRGGAAYLAWLLNHFGNDPVLALAGYNAGENAVTGQGGVPDYAETRDYVPKVLAAYAVARGLCRTPPELLSDGCVFVNMGG